MRTKADRFLSAFNLIEQGLKEQLNVHRHFSFMRMIDSAKKKHPLVMKYELDLKKFAELRNVIVHEQVSPDFIIADPHITIVEKIEQIYDELIQPDKVFPNYEKKVTTFQINKKLADVLEVIQRKSYTQFPIYEKEKFVGLLTENGISSWLAHHIKENTCCPTTVGLQEVMTFEGHKDNVIFVDKDCFMYEVKELFVNHIERKMTRLDAVLITKNGEKNNPPLGIITPFDVIRL
ncbi:CBS domain-containing protein [Bacillus sp. FJAT-45350]|uniref:CBS domain-containing protein n=1 Tax=Bacillus sp. FJAT-45350 TaxID=2011014 RepID=UPI000BB92476|nr:CBS domain-containing protein [Bacillus sp. FJAT-45350]